MLFWYAVVAYRVAGLGQTLSLRNVDMRLTCSQRSEEIDPERRNVFRGTTTIYFKELEKLRSSESCPGISRRKRRKIVKYVDKDK